MAEQIVSIDIETAPDLAWTWGHKWEPSILEYKNQSYILSFSAKWLNGSQVTKTIYPDKTDKKLVRELWNILNKAEIVIGFNSDKFDLKRLNTRFIYYNLPPPAPYKSVDLIKTVRNKLALNSNKLDDVLKYYSVGMKLEHEGKDLWIRCMNGDRKAFKQMALYNAHDTLMTEKLYLRLLPWIRHPVLSPDSNKGHCPRCESTDLEKRGFMLTNTGKYQRFQCKDCHGWTRSTINLNYEEGTRRKPFVII